MKLFEKDSVEDLLLRGYGNVQIGKMTGVSMRLYKTQYLEKLKDIDVVEYCGSHVRNRFNAAAVHAVLNKYANNEMSIRDVKSSFGICWVTEKQCELSSVMRYAGYSNIYERCSQSRQVTIQKKIEQTNMFRYGGKTPMSDASVRDKVKTTMMETYGVENISQLDSTKEKKKQTTLRNHGVEHSFQSAKIREKSKATIRDKYGVDNVSQSSEIKKKKAETTFAHFGVENSLQSKEIQDKIAESLRRNHGITDSSVMKPFQIKEIRDKSKSTCLERYGVENPFESNAVQKRIRQYWREEYGVDNPFQVFEIQKRRVATMLERFGAENPFANDDVKEKIRQTNLEKYGVEFVSQSDEIQERIRQTNLERYGVEYSLQADIVREHIRKTNLERYGVECTLQSDEIRDKIRQTNLERYGVENPAQNEDIKDKTRNTNIERYGVEYAIQSKEVQERVRQTNLERYGVEYISQSDEIQERIRQTNIERYGVECVMQSPEIKQKASNTKRENGTFNTSRPEQWLLETLVSIFGEDDILTQYNCDPRYPFHCDFYIKSRDMFIELNAFWTHGNCWFDNDSIIDNIKLSEWLRGCETNDSEFYKNAIQNWTVNDVVKRDCAKQNNINYVVFWDGELDDAKLWLAMGCPDGKDWMEEYSWLPKRHLSFNRKLPEVLSSAKWITAAAKSVNGNVFYQNEITAWNENLPTQRGRLQGRLYANRFRYLGKLPAELTDAEILRGLSIARLVKGNYSSFNVKTMLEVFDKYNVHSIYDPCSGWGERLLACGTNGIAYLGCDINSALHNGYLTLIEHYKLQNVSVICDDSSNYNATTNTHDTVFTCPPYADREIYTDVGAENLNYDEFLNWWRRVVEHSVSKSTKHFMYQIDLSHRNDMNLIIENYGFEFVEEIIADESIRHENKSRGIQKRHNYESIQVFKRVHN